MAGRLCPRAASTTIRCERCSRRSGKAKAIEVKYQSLSSDDPRWRWIAPHAIGSMASGGTLAPSVRLMVPQGFFAVTHHGDQINSSERCVA
jgi:hypothetical protein